MKLPKHVHGWVDNRRGGAKPRYYLRRPGFKQVALPGVPWSPEFMDAYTAALAAATPPNNIGASRTRPGTINAALVRYYQSPIFQALATATQSARRATLERFRSEHGDKRLSLLGSHHISRILGSLRPHPQRNILKALRGFMAWAVAEKMIGADPTAGYKPAKTKDRGGFKTWSEPEIAQYIERHPIGTMAYLALALLLNTGASRGDATRLGPQHVVNGVLSV